MDKADSSDRQRWADLAEEMGGLGNWRLYVATQTMYWSPNMFRLFGLSQDQAPSLTEILDQAHPDDLEAARAWIQNLAAGRPGQTLTRIVWPDGQIRWLEGRGACEFGADGAIGAFYGVFMDVTQRQEAATALAAHKTHLDLLAEHGGDIIFELNLDRTIRYVSRAVRRLGYEPEQLIGRRPFEIVHPDDMPKILQLASDYLTDKPIDPLEDRSYRMMKAGGGFVWMEGRPTGIFNAAGELTGVISIMRDVHARRLAEIALAEREAQMRVVVDHTRDVVLQYDLDHRIIYLSAAARRYGYEPESLIGQLAGDLIHPHDRERVQQAVAGLLADAADPARDRRFRVRAADGTYFWVEGQPDIVRDSQGKPISVVSLLRDIDEQKAAADALAESERRYRLIADHTQDMIAVCDPKGVLTFVSPSSQTVLGYAPEEMVGRPSRDFVHPADIAATVASIAAHAAEGPGAAPLRTEYRAIHKDGREIWLEANPRAVFDAEGRLLELQDNTRDVTARRAAADALAESERRYRLIADHATDVIACYDQTGAFSFLSPSVATVLGYAPEELIGLDSSVFMHPDDVRPVWQAFTDFFGHNPGAQSTRVEYRALRKDGRMIWLEAHPRAVYDADGCFVEFQDVVRDITAHKGLAEELSLARDTAETAAAVKSDFMANMSHEIRTPLTAVIGFSSLISARADLDPTAREHADRIAGAGRALLALVNDVLDFSKLEAGRMELALRPVDPVAVAREALDLFTLQAESKGLDLVFVAAPGMPGCLSLDPKAVGQVLLNLLGNAVKFSEAGSVSLTLAHDPAAQRLRFEIRDSGPGLSPDQAARLFQRFSQVDASSTRRHGGTGLGLAICKGLVEAMQGEIGVDSVPGQGSTFWFVIPAIPATATPAASNDGEAAWSLEGLRLLVVDDNPINRELVRAVLQPMGVEVAEAVDGASGLEIASRRPFDIILLDIRMPGLGGPQVLARLRAEEGPNRDIPILAFSAEVDAATAAAGFDDFVGKPLEPAALIYAIARWTAYDEPAEERDLDAG